MASRFFSRLNSFRTSQLGVVVFYGYLIAILIAGIFIGKVIKDNHKTAIQVERALCAQKHGYEVTYRGGKKFLHEHPNGSVDFSKDVIIAAILQAKVQLAAFKDVTCEP